MKVLFITKYFYPHIGGVEKHVLKVSESLIKKGHSVNIICEIGKSIKGVQVNNINYPRIKLFGLFKIWLAIFKLRKLINQADVIHIHDVFIWYLPFRLIFPNKNVYLTLHGWEGKYPISLLNVFQKRLAVYFSFKTIAIGKYIEKYYGVKADKIMYGAND